MELPKTASELAIWLGMQFPVVAIAAFLIRWSVKHTEHLHEKRIQDNRMSDAALLHEKDLRLRDRDARIQELQNEVAELRAKLSRSKKPGSGEEKT